jgi:hypothetical protein
MPRHRLPGWTAIAAGQLPRSALPCFVAVLKAKPDLGRPNMAQVHSGIFPFPLFSIQFNSIQSDELQNFE